MKRCLLLILLFLTTSLACSLLTQSNALPYSTVTREPVQTVQIVATEILIPATVLLVPGGAVKPTSTTNQAEAVEEPLGYVSFIINVHDFYHVGESSDTLLRLMDLFEKYGIRGDFYLTAPMVQFFVEQRPDLIERLKNSAHTISYHTRPPHPTYMGFDQRLNGLTAEQLERTLRDYETYRLDLATGDLFRDQPGGFSYVKDVFGRSPVTVSILNARWRQVALPIFAELGAKMTLLYHETGTDLRQPFNWVSGLLVRPSDFSITRWSAGSDKEQQFWWNMLDTPWAAQYNPTQHLQSQLDAWQADRPPFVTVLIHDDNFYSRGATPWALVYYSDPKKGLPLSPPFNLSAPDASKPRSQQSQDALWSAYEELVAYAAANLKVVTSEDIVALAKEAR